MKKGVRHVRYYQALQAAKTDGDKRFQGMTECKIARLFYEISMLSDAIKHYNASLEFLKQGEWKEEEIKALNIAQQHRDMNLVARYTNNLASRKGGQVLKALNFSNEKILGF